MSDPEGPAQSQFAETLERHFLAGRNGEVERLVLASGTEQVAAKDLSKGLALAVSIFELGEVNRSLALLDRIAVHAETLEDRLKIALARFGRAIQFQSPIEWLPQFSTIRELATATGSKSAVAALHLTLARAEALRGDCVRAERHVDIAAKCNGQTADPIARFMLKSVEASLQVIVGNLEKSRVAASGALSIATRSQSRWLSACALGNLGMLATVAGDDARARGYLSEAYALSDESLFTRLGVVDSLAQLAILTGDLDSCESWLSEFSTSSARAAAPCQSWYGLAHQITRCQYFGEFGDWDRVLETTANALPEVARRDYRALRTVLLCCEARAHAGNGDHAKSDVALASAIRACPRGAAEPLIIWETARAVCFARRGDTTLAACHFDRALAAANAIGHGLQERHIARERSASLATRVTLPGTASDRATTLLIGDVANVVRSGHSLDLMRQRIAALLDGTALRGRFTIAEDESRVPVDTGVLWDATSSASTIVVSADRRRLTLRFAGADSLDDITLLKAFVEILRAALLAGTHDGEETQEAALWPAARLDDIDDGVFWSPRMAEIRHVAIRLAATDLPILITGETGTGKELVARLIHDNSAVRQGPFVGFNCAALPRDLVESQLFGHRRGAFTGALEASQGVIRAAERGTVFLDEIVDLEPGIQPKLLRFLERGEVHPVGEPRPVPVKVRVVAATNADVDALAQEGRFRRDLLYRIGVARIELPPLRERKDEIPALASLFARRFARDLGREHLSLGDDCVAALLLHDWPGNIRELANELRRVVALAPDGATIGAAALSPAIQRHLRDVQARAGDDAGDSLAIRVRFDQPLDKAVEALERAFVDRAMAAANGRVAEAAAMLGLSRKGLFLKRRRWGTLD